MPDHRALEPLRRVSTDILDIAYYEAGPTDGDTVLLLHGFPYDIHSYAEVAPRLADSGFRVVVPHLRGHGPTRFLSATTPRSGQQAALQDIAAAAEPVEPEREAGFWYFYYFLTERGRAGVARDPQGVARVIWKRNSPRWPFREQDLERAARSFANPDHTDVVVHPYRHRLGFAPGAEPYARLEEQLAGLPPITVPAITLDGLADGNFPATDGSSTARHFTGPRLHRTVADAGHNLPQERPEAFAAAVRDVRDLRQGHPARARLTGRRQDTT
ncbi:alpha/beta fold hydrolase [Streptomyces sp. NPDC004822]